ncbi:MAG: hypothetical protein Q7K16_01390 [Candidatus Azambacteria bacterium]|nr:hypothetical protein [Candidatus Azambacteria bacterium]
MKNNKKLLVFAAVLSIVCLPIIAFAQYKLETGIPGVPGGQLPTGSELPSYLKYLFIFGLGFITILALSVMMFGGIQYILAAGNAAKTEEAKEWIKQALFGLGLLLVSYLLLRTINPDLVNLRNPNLPITGGGGVIGGGGKNYQWTTVPMNKYCADVLGKDWVTVDGNLCPAPRPGLTSECCGYFPPK